MENSKEKNGQELTVNNSESIPDEIKDILSRWLMQTIYTFLETPQGQEEFEEWKEQQKNK